MNKSFNWWRFGWGMSLLMWLAGAPAAFAQLEATQFEVVYTQVMQPPRLPDGSSGAEAIRAAVQKLLVYPRKAGSPALKPTDGAIVTLVVHATGRIGKVRVLTNLGTGFEQALRKAIAQLPAFEPGRQEGEKVGVYYAFGIGASSQYAFDPKALGSGTPPPGWPMAEAMTTESPRLPGGGSFYAAMDERLVLPPAGSPTPLASAPVVSLTFIVDAKGYIVDPLVEPSNTLAFNRAALQTLAEMPLLKPGIYNGKPVATYMRHDVIYPKPEYMEQARQQMQRERRQPVAPAEVVVQEEPQRPATVYTYVEQMPQLLEGGGYGAIGLALRQRIPAATGTTCAGSRVLVAFIVRPDGTITDLKLAKGAGNRCDAAVLAAVGKLGRLHPGKQNGRSVNVACTVAVVF